MKLCWITWFLFLSFRLTDILQQTDSITVISLSTTIVQLFSNLSRKQHQILIHHIEIQTSGMLTSTTPAPPPLSLTRCIYILSIMIILRGSIPLPPVLEPVWHLRQGKSSFLREVALLIRGWVAVLLVAILQRLPGLLLEEDVAELWNMTYMEDAWVATHLWPNNIVNSVHPSKIANIWQTFFKI